MKDLFSFLGLRRAKTITLYFLLIGLGYLQCYVRDPKNNDHHFTSIGHRYSYCEIILLDEPDEKEKSYRVEVEVLRLVNLNSSIPVQGKALLYIQKSKEASSWHEGQHFLLPNNWSAIPEPKNPGSFNYKQYCSLNGIEMSMWVKPNGLKPFCTTSISIFHKWSQHLREQIDQFLPDSTTQPLARALLLGYRKGMDDDLYQAYANTGVMHLIAISGMHMGLLYTSLQFLGSVLPFFKERKKLVMMSTVLGLWIFTCITGMQPSILRSVIMFTLLGIGQIIHRKSSLLNTLSLSAFLLLCFFPNWLFDTGFQLSYMAVLSLHFYYKPIYNLWYCRFKIVDFVWKILAATLSAQCLTIPLTLYYFHQFPLSFLFTNLIGLLTTTMIIYLEFFLLLCSPLPSLASWVGALISHLIHFTNDTVLWFSHQKWNSVHGLYLETYQVLLLYVLIGCISIVVLHRIKIHLFGFLIVLWMFIASILIHRWTILHQHHFVVLDIKGKNVFGFIQGPKIRFNPSTTPLLPKDTLFILQPFLDRYHLKKDSGYFVAQHVSSSYELYQFRERCYMKLIKMNFNTLQPLKLDLVMLPDYLKSEEFVWIIQHIDPQTILVHQAYHHGQVMTLGFKKLANKGFRVHFTRSEGAYFR